MSPSSEKISFFEEDVSYQLKNKNKIRQWLLKAAHREGFSIYQVNYIFCSNKFLLAINVEYLHHDYFTDIITFPYPTGKKKLCADIFISVDQVKLNAKTFRQVFTDELHRVMMHGLLHLMGYKDKAKSQKRTMTVKEDFYLSLRNI